ncbi:MAG: hypothetical protein WBM50_19095 [Acidimicrobiales bacterium]
MADLLVHTTAILPQRWLVLFLGPGIVLHSRWQRNPGPGDLVPDWWLFGADPNPITATDSEV